MKSHVSIFDIETGAVEPVLVTDRHMEAPNWTPDGTALIVNSTGKLYRVPFAEPSLQRIETGFACRINNDHGISPDGRTLVISDSTETGQSCIYTLPLAGGEPKRITRNVPSYWHGWSPDGSTLAYVGKRDATFQVFTCSVEGGQERQLTHGFDHCDGPDYTPCGGWIWFNGEKAGSVQLWRMPAEGGEPEVMTGDERMNWFPHPSPDGKHVLYLAYESGTSGHPANRDVELRLMPAVGGKAKVLLRLVGGQGTINVPCWAPDSRRFAFVRYTAG